MKHLGDITKIDWNEVEPPDCVTGGSPCQDLSIAGKRVGLAGERSGLYVEQIRCVKELRKASERTGKIQPRYMVWENVPGAFSSNGGKDFAAVLEEAVRIVEPEAPSIPAPAKWPTSGCLMGAEWSIAWRVHDAQFWGVPQRRKRIALVCDFGGYTAPEILFERKGLRRDTSEGRTAREGIAENPQGSANAAIPISDKATRYQGKNGDGSGNGLGIGKEGDPSSTLTSGDKHAIFAYQRLGEYRESDVGSTCRARDCKDATDLIKQGGVRRLTPLECERLQGYPDGWTDIGDWIDSKGKKHQTSDSNRYKALGNSIALPFWFWLLRRISAQYERPATLGSLFDGIGGFPLCWERCNGKGTALWASEIEEFPIAVTKERFK